MFTFKVDNGIKVFDSTMMFIDRFKDKMLAKMKQDEHGYMVMDRSKQQASSTHVEESEYVDSDLNDLYMHVKK